MKGLRYMEQWCRCDKSSREVRGRFIRNNWTCNKCIKELKLNPLSKEEVKRRLDNMLNQLEQVGKMR